MISKEETLRLLIAVRDDLASGRITASQFDMGVILGTRECGTVGCIAGWMLKKHDPALSDDGPFNFHSVFPSEMGLTHLFFEYPPNKEPLLTPAQAVHAIDAYLAGSDDPWAEVIP